MSVPVREFDTLVPPWDDQQLLGESDVIERTEAVVERAKAAGCMDAARARRGRDRQPRVGVAGMAGGHRPCEQRARRARGQALPPLGMRWRVP